uniref:Large ribosomal subunit protein uL24c n=1 Tax=Thuretia quercifolia TaxID=189650 RepID=A0A1Z1MK50_9FLOR|nr:ribosomal protein L24 [Thuretia quercifolia]ARW66470.1 ribosomal protein L24 [Thuretia quercifolia]
MKKNQKIKIGDIIKVISGKQKNKEGKVFKIISKKNHIFIENINLKIKHIKPKQPNETGEIKQIEGYIDISNIKKI